MSKKQQEEWNCIWGRKNFIQRIVDIGRKIYNFFFLKWLKSYSGKDKTFLEVGCGAGSLLSMLDSDFKKLVGLDISEVALKKAQKSIKQKGSFNITFVKGDCFALPFPDNSFDLIWSQGLLEHFDQPEKILQEQYRVCKKGGYVLVSVPFKYSYHLLWYKLTRPKIFRFLWPWTDQRFYSKKELNELGTKITSACKTFFLQPFLFGIVILELRK